MRCNVYAHVNLHKFNPLPSTDVCTHVCTHVSTDRSTHAHTYIRACPDEDVYTNVVTAPPTDHQRFLLRSTQMSIHTSILMSMRKSIHMSHTHVYTHTYMSIQARAACPASRCRSRARPLPWHARRSLGPAGQLVKSVFLKRVFCTHRASPMVCLLELLIVGFWPQC